MLEIFFENRVPQKICLKFVQILRPACFLNPSNWTGLKSGLFNCSQMPRNSIVLRFRSQLRIRLSGFSGFLFHACSLKTTAIKKNSRIRKPISCVPDFNSKFFPHQTYFQKQSVKKSGSKKILQTNLIPTSMNYHHNHPPKTPLFPRSDRSESGPATGSVVRVFLNRG